MKTKIILSLVLSCSLVVACAKKAAAPVAAVDNSSGGGGGSDPSVPAALVKTVIRCDTLTAAAGSVMNGTTNDTSFTMAANGTYSMYTVYKGGTGCIAGRFGDGSEDVFDFAQEGTFTVDAQLGDGSYQVSFTPVTQSFTGRTGTLGAPMKAAVNGNCSPTPGLTGSSTVSILGITCGSGFNSQYVIPSTPLIGAPIKQIIKSNGSSWAVGARDDIFHLGQVSAYPGATSETWYVYP